MKTSQRIVPLLLCLCLVATLGSAGCEGKSSSKPMPPKQEAGQKPKAPETIKDMGKDIDKILTELDKKARQQRMPQITEQKPPQQAKGATSQSGGGESQEQGQGQSKQQQGGGSGQEQSKEAGKQPAAKKPSLSEEWRPITMTVMKIHKSWNQLEPEAAKAGMTSKDRQAFESSLDKLTHAASKQKLSDSMKAASELYRDFGTVVSYFAYPIPRDYYEVSYQVLAVMAAAFTGNWTTADQHVKAIEEPWMRLQMQVGKEQKSEVDRTGFAIKDLTQAVEQKNVELTFIKGEIAIKNLKKMEIKLSKKEA